MSDEAIAVRAPRRWSLEQLAALARGPLRAAGAERAVVFGSWARGSADGFSDLDLAVVLDTDLPRIDRPHALSALVEALPLAVDLLVFTPEEFEVGLRDRFGVFDSIAGEGVTIYARSEN